MKKKVSFVRVFPLFLLSFLYFNNINAQLLPPEATGNKPQPLPVGGKDEVVVDHSDSLIYISHKGELAQKIIGNVEMHQQNMFLSCDSALIFNSTNIKAFGHVLIQQGDSTNIFSDVLTYDSKSKNADLSGEVVLTHATQQLFTTKLNYNTGTKIAKYNQKAILTDGKTQLTSKKGTFDVNNNMAYFKNDVVVVDPRFDLRSDTLVFNTTKKIVYFVAPTRINQDSSKIYCEGGFYDIINSRADFISNAQYQKGSQKAYADTIKYDGLKKLTKLIGGAHFIDDLKIAKADSIVYNQADNITYLMGNAHFHDEKQSVNGKNIQYDRKNESIATEGRSIVMDKTQILEADTMNYNPKTGLGMARGNIVWQDTVQRTIIKTQNLDYNKKTDYIKAFGKKRPLFISLIDKDTMYMTSDTLLFTKKIINKDTSRQLLAYHDVRILKIDSLKRANFNAVCDSLTYNDRDSLFRLFKNPIVWSDSTSQFSADTINIMLANKKIDKVFLISKALIVNTPNEIYFNQIKGKLITAFFEESKIRRMKVDGNAETVYYAQDDKKAYIGVNKALCSSMLIFFAKKKEGIAGIKFYSQPKATMTPMTEAKNEKLDGFIWDSKRKPKTYDSLF